MKSLFISIFVEATGGILLKTKRNQLFNHIKEQQNGITLYFYSCRCTVFDKIAILLKFDCIFRLFIISFFLFISFCVQGRQKRNLLKLTQQGLRRYPFFHFFSSLKHHFSPLVFLVLILPTDISACPHIPRHIGIKDKGQFVGQLF